MVVILLTVKYNNAIMTACFKTCEGLRTAFLNVNHHLSLIQNIRCLFDVAAA